MKKKYDWAKDESARELLRNYLEQGNTYSQIADTMGTTRDSIATTTKRYNLRKGIAEPKPVSNKKEDLSKLIVQTLKDELSNIIPYKPAIQSKEDIKGDTLVIHITDLHAGKTVKNQEGEIIYNEEVFRTRIDILCEQTLKLLDKNISKGVPIKDVVIISTGDLCNGEGIYLTQAFEQEIAPPKQVMLVVDVITKLIVSLLKRGLSVKFYGVRGNHGRTAKDTSVDSNWDIMVYAILDFWSKLVLKNPKLQIKFAETEHMVFNIRGHNFMIRHIAPEQCDSPAGRVKINEWARQYNVEGIIYGHYHHASVSDCDDVRVFRGGSTVGGDSLSDSMAKHSEPIQLIFGVNESRVSTFIYFVDLGDKK